MWNKKVLAKVLFFIGCLLIGMGISKLIFGHRHAPSGQRPHLASNMPPELRGYTIPLKSLFDLPNSTKNIITILEQLPANNGNTVIFDASGATVHQVAMSTIAIDSQPALKTILNSAKIHWGIRIYLENPNEAEMMIAATKTAYEYGATILALGPTEDAEFTPEQWNTCLKQARAIFPATPTAKNTLIYVTPRSDLADVTWLSNCDLLGVAGPFPLSGKKKPSDKDLADGWDAQLIEISSVAERYLKPAVLFDVSYPASVTAASHPDGTAKEGSKPSEQAREIQLNCYKSALLATRGQANLHGVILRYDTPPALPNDQFSQFLNLLHENWAPPKPTEKKP